MRWRGLVSVTAVAVALTACGGSGGTEAAPSPTATGAPSASPSATPERPAVDVVRAALKATRAKGTASYVVDSTTSLGPGHVTLRREGAYDLKRGVSRLTQTMSAEPRALLKQLVGKDVDPETLTSLVVVAGDVAYLRMPAWPASARNRWLRFTEKEAAVAQGMELSLDPLPAPLLVLGDATPAAAPRTGNTYYVTIAAQDALAGLASSSMTRALTQAGIDFEALTTEVQVAVEVRGGLVTSVKYDAIEVLREAWGMAGMANLSRAITSIETTVRLTAHGTPVTVAVPSGRAVMTAEEFEEAT